MVLLQGFQGGLANNDEYVGRNQFAYAENVFVRNPQKVTLQQKPENYALTGGDLVLSKIRGEFFGRAYMGTHNGKIYNKGNADVLGVTADGGPISSLFSTVSFIYWGMQTFKVGRINLDNIPGGPSYVSGQLQTQPTYTETHSTSSTNFLYKFLIKSSTEYYILTQSGFRSIDANYTVSSFNTWNGIGIGMWETMNYWKCFTSTGNLVWADGQNTTTAANKDYSGTYIEGIQVNDLELLISGLSSENTNIFTPSGERKELLAISRKSGPEQKEVHYYGRKINYFPNATQRQIGQNTHASYNNICYMINNKGVMTYGKAMPGMPESWNLDITRNYNGDAIDEIGMVAIEDFSDGTSWMYYSWKVGSNCGVDRYALDKANAPEIYCAQGELHTQIFNFGHDSMRIETPRIRAKTTPGQTIALYASVNGGSWELIETMNNTGISKFTPVNFKRECYTIQWKFVFTTNDSALSPELYAFGFTPIPHNHG